jgi:hypothetical protein
MWALKEGEHWGIRTNKQIKGTIQGRGKVM